MRLTVYVIKVCFHVCYIVSIIYIAYFNIIMDKDDHSYIIQFSREFSEADFSENFLPYVYIVMRFPWGENYKL